MPSQVLIIEDEPDIRKTIDYNLKAISIKEKYPQIFDWLKLQDFNVLIILILMLIVGGINMITSLLIIISYKFLVNSL